MRARSARIISAPSWCALSLARSPGVQRAAYRLRSQALSWSWHLARLRSLSADVRSGAEPALARVRTDERATRAGQYLTEGLVVAGLAFVAAVLVRHAGSAGWLASAAVVAGALVVLAARRVRRGIRAVRAGGPDGEWLSFGDIGARTLTGPARGRVGRLRARRAAARRAARYDAAAAVGARPNYDGPASS